MERKSDGKDGEKNQMRLEWRKVKVRSLVENHFPVLEASSIPKSYKFCSFPFLLTCNFILSLSLLSRVRKRGERKKGERKKGERKKGGGKAEKLLMDVKARDFVFMKSCSR